MKMDVKMIGMKIVNEKMIGTKMIDAKMNRNMIQDEWYK
jgi:hypothetical protein